MTKGIDLKKHSLVSDNSDHFVVSGPDGNSFKVSKHGLDAMTKKRIASLSGAVGMADGGMAEMPDASTNPMIQEEYVSPGMKPAGIESQLGSVWDELTKQRGSAPSPEMLTKYGSVDEAAKAEQFQKERQPSLADGMQTVSQTAPIAPAQPQINPNDWVSTPPTTQKPPAAGEGTQNEMYDYGKQTAQYINTANTLANKIDLASKQSAKAYADAYDSMRKAQLETEASREKLNKQAEELTLGIQSGEINPNRLWENTSTPNKIIAGIGVVLGGIGGGLLKTGQNAGLSALNSAIERDIEAQKSNLNNKQSMLSKNMEMTKNLDLALDMTRSQQTAMAAAYVAGIEAKLGVGPKALEAQKLRMDLMSSAQAQNEAIAKRMSAARLFESRGTYSDLISQSPEVQERAVIFPNKEVAISYSKEDAKEVRKNESAITNILGIIDRLEDFMKQGPALPATERKARSQELATELLLEMKDVKKLGVLSKNDEELLNKMIAQPTAVLNKNELAKLQEMRKSIEGKRESVRQSHLMNYRPVQKPQRSEK